MAKKKMTKAQAAAARYEKTPHDIAKAKAREDNKVMQEQRRIAQKKASSISMMRLIVPLVVIILIVIASLVFTIGPGMVMGG